MAKSKRFLGKEEPFTLGDLRRLQGQRLGVGLFESNQKKRGLESCLSGVMISRSRTGELKVNAELLGKIRKAEYADGSPIPIKKGEGVKFLDYDLESVRCPKGQTPILLGTATYMAKSLPQKVRVYLSETPTRKYTSELGIS